MAKIGLNYGEKLQIADKTYRVITDGLNVPEVLGKLSFRGIEGPDIIYEEDRTQRNPDGSFVQINTGEIRGLCGSDSFFCPTLKPSFSPLLTWHSLKLKT